MRVKEKLKIDLLTCWLATSSLGPFATLVPPLNVPSSETGGPNTIFGLAAVASDEGARARVCLSGRGGEGSTCLIRFSDYHTMSYTLASINKSWAIKQ